MPAPSPALSLVPLSPALLDTGAAIVATAPDPWTRANLEVTITDPHRHGFVALQENTPVGIACFLALAGSADLEIIAVAPAARRQGIAGALLAHSFAVLQTEGITRCLLEVRAGNAPAQALYRQLGFKTLARRPGMYQHPPEDGFLMAKDLRAPY